MVCEIIRNPFEPVAPLGVAVNGISEPLMEYFVPERCFHDKWKAHYVSSEQRVRGHRITSGQEIFHYREAFERILPEHLLVHFQIALGVIDIFLGQRGVLFEEIGIDFHVTFHITAYNIFRGGKRHPLRRIREVK